MSALNFEVFIKCPHFLRSQVARQLLRQLVHLDSDDNNLLLRENCLNTEFFLVQIQENTDQKKLRIWILSTQCTILVIIFETM